jgi:predicted NUDIX family phosphoesterase
MGDELVLGVSRTLLEELGCFQGICFDVDSYVDHILSGRNTRFMPRIQAEVNSSFKQIIPYVLIRNGQRFLHYVRGKSSGEKRLVSKGSIGVGGHINPTDQSLFDTGREFYESAVQRELHEELKMDGHFQTRIVALLNDDSTPVGTVHLGIVHLCELNGQNVTKGEAVLTELRFLPVEELRRRREDLESWSQFCLDHLDEITQSD